MGKFSLVVASAYYEVKAYSPYISSLMSSLRVLQEVGIKYLYMDVSQDSYVDRAKNTLVNQFLKTDYTHLMIIDSDLEWDVEGFGRLLQAAMQGAEVVGGAYLVKSDFTEYAVVPYVEDGQIIGNEECGFPVIRVLSLPGGFTIFSRKAFERTRPVLNTYDMDEPVLEAFRCNITKENARLGEDIYFQRKYMSQGGKIYLVPNITLTHYGVKGYTGNYDMFLQRRPGGSYHDTLIENLRNVHKGEEIWIIGKGPSLQYLKKEDIGKGPVIAINEAIIPIELLGLDNPIYALQKDADPPEKEPIAPPRGAILLVHEREVPNRHKDYKQRYIFDNIIDFDVPWNAPSSHSATYISQLMGCKKIVFVSFDACTSEVTETCHYSSDGSYVIDSAPGSDSIEGREYIAIGKGLKRLLAKRHISFEWVTPKERGNDGVTEQAGDN